MLGAGHQRVAVRVQVGLRPARASSTELRFSSRPFAPRLPRVPLFFAALFFSSVYSASIRYFPLARAFIALVLRIRRKSPPMRRENGRRTLAATLLRVPEESKPPKARVSNPSSPLPSPHHPLSFFLSFSDPNYRSPRMDVLVMGNCREECCTRGTYSDEGGKMRKARGALPLFTPSLCTRYRWRFRTLVAFQPVNVSREEEALCLSLLQLPVGLLRIHVSWCSGVWALPTVCAGERAYEGAAGVHPYTAVLAHLKKFAS